VSGPTAATVVQASLASAVRRLRDAVPAIRAGDDPEDVHRARVATRRLRSDLRVFAPVLHRDRTAPFRHELRWLGRALGVARDADVLSARMEELSQTWIDARAATPDEVASVLEAVRRQDAAVNEALRTMLASDRTTGLLERLGELGDRPPVAGGARRPAAELAVPLLRVPLAALHDIAEEARGTGSDAALHRVRIAAKHVRYAADSFSEVTPAAGDLAAAAESLQDLLGAHQDAVVAEAWLRSFGHDALAAEQRAAASSVGDRWERAYKAIRRSERGLAA
jgi:CHAD domain-containing protein